jgi:hypothetical protein
MRFAERVMSGMTGMQMGIIFDMQDNRRKRLHQFTLLFCGLFDPCSTSFRCAAAPCTDLKRVLLCDRFGPKSAG